MSFDPITYAAANAAKLPLGTFIEAFPGDVPTGDWVHLDGTLISKAAYPKAADILGEALLFNATPTETTVSLTLPTGASILRFNATEGLSLSIGDTLLFAVYQSGSSNTYRLWRSGDNGGTWVSVDLTLPTTTSTVSPLLLEWFGAGRAVLILKTTSSNNLIVTTTSDYGQTWTAPRSICSYTNSNVVVQLSSDAGLPLDGGGYYYFSVTDGSAYNLYALNSSNNITSPLSLGAEYTLIGGRIITSGTSEVHVVSATGIVQKTTFNGSSFSGLASSGITTNTTLNYPGTRRIGLTSSTTGDYLIPGNGYVFKLPANWSGAAVSVLYNVIAGVNIPQRLLSNTLVNIDTRAWFNLNTGVETLLPGLNAGPGSVIDQNTSYSRFGHTKPVVSYLGNVFGANQSVDLIQYSVGSPNPVLVLFSRRSMFEFFLAAHSKSLQRDSFAPYSNLVANHYIASTRQLRTVSVVGTSAPYSLSIKTYNQANDYSQYLHLPYLPGLCCKLR